MTRPTLDRREFLALASLGGGAVFASGLYGCATPAAAGAEDFFFVQLSDSHWGFEGPPNPDARGTLPKAVAAVNALSVPPDFIVFTGDLTHTTDDPRERRERMAQFRDIVSGLKVQERHFLPGEHDASLDHGKAFQEFFGPTHYTFDHKGLHFIVLDNVSDPAARLGDEQLQWLRGHLATLPRDTRLVVLTHRPLFDLAPQWDWATRDGEQAVALLMPFADVTVFYGHIHQEHHHMTGHIAHHAARSLIFPLPAPLSAPRRLPLPWNPEHPYEGLGFRGIQARAATPALALTELPVVRG
ncbi:metallophosphoesterase family protein [Variovorax terrae]|uniref:Metallophosphoesterase n=1 Tax=Variovorax terrae TaxID=2923278 RepID=A0A9X1VSS9_9BURK|nr:metallophosphoesterase [Variovorax terrae]MCJ0762414.1 metallophosphoesterase [Variovorax terrae]